MENSLPKNGMRPIHPGEVLREEFMLPAGHPLQELAGLLHMEESSLKRLLAEERALTDEDAEALSFVYGASEEFWVGLQRDYARRKYEVSLGAKLKENSPHCLTAEQLNHIVMCEHCRRLLRREMQEGLLGVPISAIKDAVEEDAPPSSDPNK